MSFPQTRHSLIQRIAASGDESAWREFLTDYWGPVCRFAIRRGNLQLADAEDVAGRTFQALIENRLLARWVSQRSARLRTLLCSVVRNVLANRQRVEQGRERLLREHARDGDSPALPLLPLEVPAEQVDAFYAAWVEELLQQAVESLLTVYHREARGDYFRVLHGRLCDGMTTPEVAQALGMTVTQAENAYKHARRRLAERLRDLVRDHVERYSPAAEVEADLAAEWGQLGEFLKRHGGLEQIVGRACAAAEPSDPQRRASAIQQALTHLTDQLRQPHA
jgi:RNA polymerase sigma factor (sigma-70 family)